MSVMPGRFTVGFAENEAGCGDISVHTDVLDAGDSPLGEAVPRGGGRVPRASHVPAFRVTGDVGDKFVGS